MRNLKLFSAVLFLAAIICLLIPVSATVQAVNYTLVKSANPVVSSGNFASNGTVIYDSSAGLYKM